MDVKHSTSTTMLLFILGSFSLLVIVIGLTTAKLNAKAPCDHNWVKTNNDDIRCSKCFRVIRRTRDTALAETQMQPIKDKVMRPEGVRIAPNVFKDAD